MMKGLFVPADGLLAIYACYAFQFIKEKVLYEVVFLLHFFGQSKENVPVYDSDQFKTMTLIKDVWLQIVVLFTAPT